MENTQNQKNSLLVEKYRPIKLENYVGNENMVICRPRSQKAWLWTKISDL